MLQTPLCRQLGIDYPIFSVGFAAGAGPELAAAVSNAGACGVLGGSGQRASDVHADLGWSSRHGHILASMRDQAHT